MECVLPFRPVYLIFLHLGIKFYSSLQNNAKLTVTDQNHVQNTAIYFLQSGNRGM